MTLIPALRSARSGALLALALSLSTASMAQQKLLTLDDLYDPDKKIEFGGTPATC